MICGHSLSGRALAFLGGFIEAAAAGAVELGEFDFLIAVEAGGGIDELLAVQDVEGGAIDGLGFGFPPVPERAEDGGGAPPQFRAAGDAPDLVGVAFLGDGGGDDGLFAALLEPFGALEAGEFGFEDGGDLQKIVGVLDRVIEHLRRERTPGPVGLLRGFGEFHPEVALDERGEAEFRNAAEARGDHGVEDAFRCRKADAAEQAQIVVGAVNNELLAVEGREKGIERKAGERIDQQVVSGNADLDEAELLEVAVEAVRLGIDGDARVRSEQREDRVRGFRCFRSRGSFSHAIR